MTVIGKHITADMYGCKFELLDDRDYIKQAVLAAIAEGQLTLLQYTDHPLTPQGVAAIALLTESHISVHTYPHLGYAAVDIFTFSEAALPTKALQTALTAAGIYVVPQPDLHTHFAVIDQEIVWYGNTNLLSRDKEDDGLMRIGSRDVALELLEEIGR